MDVPQFIHLPVKESWLLPTFGDYNKAAVTIHMQVFVWT